jgi:hypothetical protein
LASQQAIRKPKLECGQDFILGVTSKNQVSENTRFNEFPTVIRRDVHRTGEKMAAGRFWFCG